MNGRLALESVRGLADDVRGLVKRRESHDHELHGIRLGELAHLSQIRRVVLVEAVHRIRVERREVIGRIQSVLRTPSRIATDGTTTMNFRIP